ncbi:MAG: phosphoglycerate kinase [bacterium]|nr:phosphoglycerate kinase [bacterium]
MKFVDQLNLKGKKVFIRADLNVPLKDGKVADDHRIRSAMDTVNYVLSQGASVVLASHLGRPKDKPEAAYSLAPVAKRIEEISDREVIFAPDCVGPEVEALAAALQPGQILLLENLRFHAEESANDREFSRKLACLAEVYVNDAFGTAHRAHASTAGMTEFMAEKAGGLTIKSETEYFAKAFENPAHPLVAIMGGAKMETKIKAIRHVATKADVILVGGAMANTFFKAQGYGVGKSLVEDALLDTAREIIEEFKSGSCKLVIPVDVVCSETFAAGATTTVRAIDAIGENEMAVDIGPETVKLFCQYIDSAKTIIWNGPLGAFEITEFSAGTFGVVDALAETSALTVIGGGDTDLALHQRHAFEKMDYVSTGGGAFLKLLEGKTLPALAVL